MSASGTLVLRAARNPESTVSLGLAEWDKLLRRARNAGVLSRLAASLDGAGTGDALPPKVQDQLTGARIVAAQHERVVRWEVDRIQRALHHLDVELVLLKGAAYVMAGLPPGRGRLVSDVDILVPRTGLADVEHALLAAGWEAIKLDPYDQRYYRNWMHELPPLQHAARKSLVDVHHSILPESGRLRPDPRKLLEASRPLDGSDLRVLAPADMVLHSAVHLFQDGDLAGGLRDLTDLDDLLRHFAKAEAGFWDRLVPRAVELELQRPLFYALRFCRRLLHTPIPDPVMGTARVGRPIAPVTALMDVLANRALVPDLEGRAARGVDVARWLLYARSHSLRMPPWLLAQHLARKALSRWLQRDGEER